MKQDCQPLQRPQYMRVHSNIRRSPLPLRLTFPAEGKALRLPDAKWRGCSAETVLVPSSEPYEFAHTGDQHYLALHDIQLSDGELRVDTLDTVRELDIRGTLTFVPKGCSLSGWAKPTRRENRFTALYFDTAAMHEELEGRYRERSPGPAIYKRDAALQSTLGKVQTFLGRADGDSLLAEALCLTAALEVFSVISSPDSGLLSERQMRLVRDYIDEYIDQPISLSELAAAAGLSRFHFSRAFKATTGQPPYHFVAGLRVEAAAEILRRTDASLDVVSASVGLNIQQLRRLFQDRLGTTPQAFRRQVQD